MICSKNHEMDTVKYKINTIISNKNLLFAIITFDKIKNESLFRYILHFSQPNIDFNPYIFLSNTFLLHSRTYVIPLICYFQEDKLQTI